MVKRLSQTHEVPWRKRQIVFCRENTKRSEIARSETRSATQIDSIAAKAKSVLLCNVFLRLRYVR